MASVSDLAGERYDSDATLSGTVYANATQRISVEKDMIIQEVYVSKGDEVKPGDKLISFDMTLVEMELNIAKLKLQKQQQDLAAAKKRLASLQNGGPILDSDSSSADNLIDSGRILQKMTAQILWEMMNCLPQQLLLIIIWQLFCSQCFWLL